MHLNFFGCQQPFLLLVCRENVSGAYIVSAHFGKRHINLVIPIIDFVSYFITGGLTNAQKRLFDLHLMYTEDQLFLHNGLRANIFSTWMLARHTASKIHCLTVIVVINNSREAFWVNESKYLWNVLMCPRVLFNQKLSLIRSCVKHPFWYMGPLAWARCLIES